MRLIASANGVRGDHCSNRRARRVVVLVLIEARLPASTRSDYGQPDLRAEHVGEPLRAQLTRCMYGEEPEQPTLARARHLNDRSVG